MICRHYEPRILNYIHTLKREINIELLISAYKLYTSLYAFGGEKKLNK